MATNQTDSTPRGPALAPLEVMVSEINLTDRFREEALEAVLVVAQDLSETLPLPRFWEENGLFAFIQSTCDDLFGMHYITSVPCRHSPTGYRWAIVMGASQSHPWFIAMSVTLIETFTNAMLGSTGAEALCNVTFWALLESTRYGLWTRAISIANLEVGSAAPPAGIDPAWLINRSAWLRLCAYAHVCAGEFSRESIEHTYADLYRQARDVVSVT